MNFLEGDFKGALPGAKGVSVPRRPERALFGGRKRAASRSWRNQTVTCSG